MSLGVLGYSLLLVFLAATGDDRATTSPITFDLNRGPGAEQCPDHDALAAQLASRLSTTLAPVGKPAVTRVTIDIKRAPAGHVATVAAGLEGGTEGGRRGGVRTLVDDGEDCVGLAEAIVLTLSMIADAQPVSSPTAAIPTPASSSVSRPARPWQVGAGAFGSTGILGAASAGMTVDGIWHPSPWVAAGVSALWMPTRSLAEGDGTVSFRLLAGVARICGGIVPFGGRISPSLCWQAGLGGLRGTGDGYAGAQSVWVPWLVAGGTADVDLRLHPRFSLAARAGYLFSLRDAHFTIGGLGRVYDSGHPGWTGGLGVLARIP